MKGSLTRNIVGLPLMILFILLTLSQKHAYADGIVVLDWQSTDVKETYQDYYFKYERSPHFITFDNEQQAFDLIMGGQKADLIHTCSGSANIWRRKGLLKPINIEKLASWGDIIPSILEMNWFLNDEKNEVVVMPFEWGLTGLILRTDKAEAKKLASLKQLPDKAYKNKFAIPNNIDDVYSLAALATGIHSLEKINDDQFNEMSDYLRKLHKNVAFYWDEPAQVEKALLDEKISMAWAWNDSANVLRSKKIPIQFAPEHIEGATTWLCGYSILNDDAGKQTEIYDFLNALLSPKTTHFIVTQWGYGHANQRGMNEVNKELAERNIFGSVDQYFRQNLLQTPIPIAMRDRMEAEFEAIKKLNKK